MEKVNYDIYNKGNVAHLLPTRVVAFASASFDELAIACIGVNWDLEVKDFALEMDYQIIRRSESEAVRGEGFRSTGV